ncbi:hypothetical protein ElyMa_005549000 [Elysia marginata]|uniref:Uncharacterized protein n=1 Tax=Elysia marginata TaxID=1093978 RepID=A0AAV4EZC9_9GAST|nr:hypothetical protein ElyMa_005549000 [Elysia marginata]
MTSQKRFRHQENSHANSRTRDIPPRFKRQKSSSDQPSLEGRPPSPLSQQLDQSNLTDNMTKRSQISTPPGSNMNKESPSQTTSSGRVRYPVLRPVNYMYTEVPSTQAMPPQQLYQVVPSSQMWPTAGYTGGLQSVMVNPNPMMLPQTVPQITPYVNENCAPSPSFYMPQCSPVSPWNNSAYGSPYPSSCSSPAPSVPSPSPSGIEPDQEKSPQSAPDGIKSAKSPNTKYTDPDLRTIEMLRELERVADKESQEAEDGGSDRKTLVSHHLRMLMCAMDRYTEDIDDETDGGNSGNSSSNPSPSSSPLPAPSKQQQNQVKNKVEDAKAHTWNQNQIRQTQLPRSRPVLGTPSAVFPMQQRPQPRFSNYSMGRPTSNQVPRTPWIPLQDFQPAPADWNLWSSPSFNFCGVLDYPSCLDGPNENFENLQDKCFPASKERKPLYKR